MSRRPHALLIYKGDGDTLKASYCSNFPEEERLEQLLEVFNFQVSRFDEVKKNFFGSNVVPWLRENFDLTIVNLRDLSEDLARVVPVIMLSGIPCAFVGDVESISSSNVLRIISEYFPEEVLNLRFTSTGIPFFGCCASFSALLDMGRRSNLYKICSTIDRGTEAYIHDLVETHLRNLLERE